MKYLSGINKNLDNESAGNKALSLLFLKQNRYRVPQTSIVLTKAFEEYRLNGKAVLADLEDELKSLPAGIYIVRSSTNLEDSDNYTHAGQFLSIPGVSGTGALLSAVKSIWDSALGQSDSEYLKTFAIDNSRLKCAVIIQKMISPVLTGVSFSKNPITGVEDVVIEAVEGSGEDLMQNGLTPMRWIVRDDKLTGNKEKSEYDRIIKKVARTTRNIYRRHNYHIDIEWVFDGRKIYYVQLRKITGKKQVNIYSNKMAQEMLPGMVKPLVWSVNINMVNSTWIDLLAKITGPLDIKPDDLAHSFYFRTYFNIHELGKILSKFGVSYESLESTHTSENKAKHSFKPGPRAIRHTGRIIKFILAILSFENFYKKEYASLQEEYGKINIRLDKGTEPAGFTELYADMVILGKRLTYLNIIMPLLMRVYNKRLTKKLNRAGINYELIDFNHDFPELLDYTPYPAIEQIKTMLDKLPEEIRKDLKSYAELTKIKEAGEIVRLVEELISVFGHLSESGNDLSYPKWEEDPEHVFRMVLDYSDPKKSRTTYPFSEFKYSGLRHLKLRKAYIKAGRFKVYREQISSFYIYGYGLFRRLFLQLADIFISDGIIKARDDIFYLSYSDIERIIEGRDSEFIAGVQEQVLKTRKEMDDCADIILPTVIYGEEAPILDYKDLSNFKGVSASTGKYSGTARVIRQTKDFDKVKRGDIIIIPFSDVSWTPILCKAGAIVSESGGILSHCSIIAREMGIPAIVSVDNACAVKDNSKVTVDGSNGILTIHNDK
ncbi:MAG: PEP/pyruvate-binding domain-containing protein [Marinilabiliaceae bacterium]|nr:PEP/pyruvate-binding domain-containing protein [Marinilabiliaceae bacterium]